MIIPDHWLVRGAQSAIFYYISCGPCLTRSYQRRRRKEAARDRKRKEAYLADRPDIYAHPGPSEMNENWREDFDLGPSPTPRRPRKGTRDSQNRPSTMATVTSSRRSDGSLTPTSLTQPPDAHIQGHASRRRYRRPDEEFESLQEHSTSRHRTSATATTTPWESLAYRAPSVNDLHPPIVSILPLKAEERTWMTAPPPSTAFLNGKKGVTVVARVEAVRDRALTLQKASVSSSNTDAHDEQSSTTGTRPNHSPKRASTERVGTPTSRPDSAVSTGRRTSHRSQPMHMHDSTTSDSDADDEEDASSVRRSTIARPRPAYRNDSRHSKRRSGRPKLPTVASQDANSSPKTIPHPSSQPVPAPLSLAASSQNVNIPTTPRRSELSASSLVSSDAENIPSPQLQPTRSKANTTARLLAPPSTNPTRDPSTLQPQDLHRPVEFLRHSHSAESHPSYTHAHEAKTVTQPESEADIKDFAMLSPDANSSIDSSLLDLNAMLKRWKALPEKTAREQMWLGPPPQGLELKTAEKRWSTEF